MAHLPRGLCFALILWLALSRPSTASRTESPDSGQWWQAEEFSIIQKSAENLRRSGDYVALEKLYLQAVNKARTVGNMRARASYLTALGNTYVYLFRYAEAINAYVEARDLAHANSDWLAEGAVAPGLSSVYLLAGDWPAARESAQAGLKVAKRLPTPPYYEAQLKLQHARLNTRAEGSIREILEAIDAARAQSNVALEAEAWDLLGEERLSRHDLSGCEAALEQAHRLRALHLERDLRLSYWRLGALRLAQNRLDEAMRFTAAAFDLLHVEGAALSGRTLLHQRGSIHQAMGHTDLALEDFEAAARSAEHWRQAVPPPSRTSLAAADTEADRKVFRTFIEAAARQALTTGDPKWTRKALLAAERNRAASLRQSAALAEVWRRKLPPKYWATLAHLRTEETRQMQAGGTAELSESLHRELAEMESAAGLGYSPNKVESFSSETSLTLFKRGLGESELFLSFYTGAGESYLWAVTRDSLHLYKLPAADRIGKAVERFEHAVMQREKNTSELGEHLYATLFGQLDAREMSRHDWILSLEGPLFELPAAALQNGSRYLVESHSLQVTPSATWLRKAAPSAAGSVSVGVGDPIYNWADERLRPATWSTRPSLYQTSGQLNRLVASGDELQRVAKLWGPHSTTLSGENASRAAFLESLSTSPSNVFLATHVVASEDQRDRAFLAFSVGEGGRPELLGTADIAMLQVPGALVVMSGCASGAGQVSAGAGLLGLTRAWLSAGAHAVLATSWPVEDSRGDLLPAFYRNLTSGSNSISAAEALRRGQVEMIHSGNWQSDPAYWAAFHLTGGVR
ncbi:MAG: CHAT domain-containing tetratricopeptide repeat protein [Bryobacteraceae bacterium]